MKSFNNRFEEYELFCSIGSRNFFRVFLLFLLVVSFSLNATVPTSELVGSTKSSFSVTPSGAASYDIPITLPPNVGGVQPSLSINYNSLGNNGLLGIGWQLSGLSSITRCPTTVGRDGFIDGVDFDENDQFCLDGQRLVNVGGDEYRTEIDNFSLIIGNNSGFSVTTPSGLVMFYGSNDNSRIKAQGKVDILTWALDEVRDPSGNKYTIEYVNEGEINGEFRPEFIYMSNGISILSHLELVYEERLDVISGYISGSKYRTSKRLSAIKTFTNSGGLVKQYLLSYKPYVEPLNFSFISKIEECDSNWKCLDPVTLDWQEQIEGHKPASGGLLKAGRFGSYEQYSKSTGDFNGDGLTDLVWMYSGKSGLYAYSSLSKGDGSFYDASGGQLIGGSFGDSELYTESTADLNADGLVDLIWMYSGTGGLHAYTALAKEDGSFEAASGGELHNGRFGSSSTYSKLTGDFNGDGFIDLVWMYSGKSGLYAYTALGRGDGTFKTATGGGLKTGSFGSSETYWKQTGDFNGDGLTDLAWMYSGKSGLYAFTAISKGDGSFHEASGGQLKSGSFGSSVTYWKSVSDFNGDGISDLLWLYSGGSGLYAYTALGKGDGSFEAASGGALHKGSFGDYSAYSKFSRDFNGDGFSDLVWMYSGKQGLYSYIALGRGDGSFANAKGKALKGGSFGNYGAYSKLSGDFNGDGLSDLVWMYSGDGGLTAYSSLKEHLHKYGAHLVSEIDTGPETIQINYDSLVNKQIYLKGQSKDDEILDIQVPRAAVVEIIKEDGVNGFYPISYKYNGLRYDIKNRRFLGFAGVSVENHKTGFETTTYFRQDYPFIGVVDKLEKRVVFANKLISSENNNELQSLKTDEENDIVFPYIASSSKTYYHYTSDLNEVGSKRIDNTYLYDSKGQLVDSTTNISGDGNQYSIKTQNTILNNYENRRQGEITFTRVTHSSLSTPSITRESSFEYDWITGKKIKEIIEPGNPDPSIRRVTKYEYDGYGNRTLTVSCNGSYVYECDTTTLGARYSSVTFNSTGLFATQSENALGQKISRSYDDRFGIVTTVTDINGLTTVFEYDSLGRKIKKTFPNNSFVSTARIWCDSGCPKVSGIESYSKVITQSEGKPTSVLFFDQFNRQIRKQTQGFDGRLIFVDTEYDSNGRKKRISEPYFQGDSIYWNTFIYDALGRKKNITTPNQDGSYITSANIYYDGYLTTIIDALGRSIVEEKNSMGKVVKVTDKAGGITNYEYDSFGNLTSTTDSVGNRILLSYDLRGRKRVMNDPDMGIWRYNYNTFDQLISQTDAKNQKTDMDYDALGRMVSRTDLAGTNQAKTSIWTYDSASGKGKGKLYQKVSANGDYTRHSYNSTYGQLDSTQQKIGNKTFSTQYSYDSLGRVNLISYPSTVAYPNGFQVKRAYNDRGFLKRIYKGDNSLNYWVADAMSARGQLEAVTLGNDVVDLSGYSAANGWTIENVSYKDGLTLRDMTYTFDAVGNVTSRVDAMQNDIQENFDYDALDRLSSSSISFGASSVTYTPKSYEFDALGNITNKSDVGSYSYSGCGGRPHAVCSAGATAYSYDANGSMIRAAVGGRVTNITYTPFNKANHIHKDNFSVIYNYDADRFRNYKSVIQKGALSSQTYYVGINREGAKLFEQEVNSETGIKDIHYIYGEGNQAIAMHITQGIARKTEYLHRDYLGSVVMVTGEGGNIVTQLSFDPWGKRRNANWTDNHSATSSPNISGNIGYTGHEMIDVFDLVHMNGRIYNPSLGRFLSADPIIQDAYNSQSYNRYTYVMNNPLGLVDPSGYSWKRISNYIKTHKWTRQSMAIVAGALDTMGCNGVCSAVNSAFLATINGARIEHIFKYAAISYASYYSFKIVNASYAGKWELSRVVNNGLVGGVMSKASGGKFEDGFALSGGFALASYAYSNTIEWYKRTAGHPVDGESDATWRLGTKAHSKGEGVSVRDTRHINIAEKVQGDGGEIRSLDIMPEGGIVSRSTNLIPGFNSFSVIHDIGGGALEKAGYWNKLTNFGSMPPALIVNYAAILGQQPHSVTSYIYNERKLFD